jgi:hypothetical protein
MENSQLFARMTARESKGTCDYFFVQWQFPNFQIWVPDRIHSLEEFCNPTNFLETVEYTTN